MDEATHRRLDIVTKIVAGLAVGVGAGLGIWQYFDTAEKEFRKPYWEQQIELYVQATTAAATLASSSDPVALELAEAKFWQLYYGPLALVEDAGVEAAMVRFGQSLRSDREQEDLRDLSLALAHACRESLGDAWSVKLSELQGRYNR